MKSSSAARAWSRVTAQEKAVSLPGSSGSMRVIAARTARVVVSGSKPTVGRGRGLGPCLPNGSRFSLSKFHSPPTGLALLPVPSMR